MPKDDHTIKERKREIEAMLADYDAATAAAAAWWAEWKAKRPRVSRETDHTEAA